MAKAKNCALSNCQTWQCRQLKPGSHIIQTPKVSAQFSHAFGKAAPSRAALLQTRRSGCSLSKPPNLPDYRVSRLMICGAHSHGVLMKRASHSNSFVNLWGTQTLLPLNAT